MAGMQHILCADQFDLETLKKLFVRAKEMEEVLKKGGSDIARGKILATLFYEPSTRTRLSFESAMLRLGGNIISETDVHFSSIIKGEVLQDTARIISGYSDIIAIRSKNTGDADIAANFSSVPIINAGDGAGEHPTQSLLDCYTIFKQFPNIFDGGSITLSFVGDLKYGRTVHSLCTMVRNFPNINIQFIAPKETQIPQTYIKESDKIFTDLTDEVLQKSDVIYNTRIQKERFEDKPEYEKIKDIFVFDAQKVSQMDENSILMHPLPRVNEITQEVDLMPQAKYFEQAQNGIPIRMALIAQCLNI